MSEMVARVEAAIRLARTAGKPGDLVARAAIEAMREPTVDQLEACGNHAVGRIIWRQMIDEALK